MSDGPLPESTRGVDSSPEAIAEFTALLSRNSKHEGYRWLFRAAALLAQVARERDEAIAKLRASDAANQIGGLVGASAHDLHLDMERRLAEKFVAAKNRAAAAERQLAEARAALRTSHCPRPWRGDDHTVGQCVERKHCGCDNDRALLSGETTRVEDEP